MAWLTGSRVATSAVVVAALVLVFLLEPLPPLIAFERSEIWTRLTEWLALSLIGLVMLSLMGWSDTELELSTSGIRVRPASAPKQPSELSAETAAELEQQLTEMRQDNLVLQRLVQHHREEQERLLNLGVRPPGGRQGDA